MSARRPGPRPTCPSCDRDAHAAQRGRFRCSYCPGQPFVRFAGDDGRPPANLARLLDKLAEVHAMLQAGRSWRAVYAATRVNLRNLVKMRAASARWYRKHKAQIDGVLAA